MTQIDSQRSRSDYQQFRAPSADGSVLVYPAGHSIIDTVQQTFHQRFLKYGSISFAGRSLDEVSLDAREELLKLAYEWTSGYASQEIELPNYPCPLILSGHQPELYHPGVWFKNFLLTRLAKHTSGIGINLIIDSDLCREVSLRLPVGDEARRAVETVKYDEPAVSLPYEERAVQNKDLFQSFTNRIAQIENANFSSESILRDIWPNVMNQVQQGQMLGNAFSIARHQLELDNGSQTLELPISQVADTTSFRRFLVEVLTRADEFRHAYNDSLEDYRLAHKLRTPAQPLPDLGRDDLWIETPFWIWQTNQQQRKPMWCRTTSDGIELSDSPGGSVVSTISSNADRAVEQLSELRDSGIKIRSRALATTLYCRMVLADLFIHGIGGAKYDQVTDNIAIHFFGKTPPPHATATATIRLFPEQPGEVNSNEISKIKQRLRNYRFHPEMYFNANEISQELKDAIEQKSKAVQQEKTAQNAHDRHLAIEQANLQMAAALTDKMESDQALLHQLDERMKRLPITASREYSFVLFDKLKLIAQLQRLAEQAII